jgi:hypothetical protein
MENKSSKSKASAPVPVVSGGNKIVEKKLNNQVVELAPQPTTTIKKGGAKKVEAAVLESVKTVKGSVVEAKTSNVVESKTSNVVESKTSKATKATKAVQEVKGGAVETKVLATTLEAKTVKGGKAGKAGKTEKVVEATPVATVTTELEAEPEAQSKLRYFKLFYNNEICGRYCGKKPKQAANKAFSSIVKDMKKDGVSVTHDSQLEVSFTIKECTRNSKHKEYKYVGKRHLLKEPVKVSIENGDGSVKEIVYKFHNQLQKAPKE